MATARLYTLTLPPTETCQIVQFTPLRSVYHNKIGDGGAIALAESLKAMFVTCVLQVRTSLFLWHVCAHIHRRHSGTCRATVLACFSMRIFCVDVCELLGVSRREVRPDVMHCGRVLRCL